MNRTVVVTGADGVIGRTICAELSKRHGDRVVAVSRRRRPAIARSRLVNVQTVANANLFNAAALRRLATTVRRWQSGELTLVHCAGAFPRFARLGQTTPSTFHDVLAANVITLHNTFYTLLPLMSHGQGGRVVALGSLATPNAFPFIGSFVVAKSALATYVQVLAHEYGGLGISATTLALATVDTPAERRLRPAADRKRWLSPLQVAEAVSTVLDLPLSVGGGAVIPLYNYNEEYYSRSYYDRIGARVRRNSRRRK